MESQEIVNGWLAETGRLAGTALQLDANGQVCFAYAQQTPVTVSVVEGSPYVVLYAPVLAIFDMDPPLLQELLVLALAYNLPGGLKAGLSLAADEDAEHLYLVTQQDISSLNVSLFQSMLTDFMAQAQLLGQELQQRVRDLEMPTPPLPHQDSGYKVASSTAEAILHLRRSPSQLWG